MAARHSVEEMAELIGVDSLAFLSIDGLYRAVGEPRPRSGRRTFATPASPATTRSHLPDQADNSERQLSLLAESH